MKNIPTYSKARYTGKKLLSRLKSESRATRSSTNASYFSIRNLTVGYSFPRSWMKKLGIGNIRVFCSADNLLFVSKRKGFDPRLTMSGVQSSVGGYSQMRTVTGGVQFNF